MKYLFGQTYQVSNGSNGVALPDRAPKVTESVYCSLAFHCPNKNKQLWNSSFIVTRNRLFSVGFRCWITRFSKFLRL